MEQDKKKAWIKYLICFCVGVGIILIVFAIKGFSFGDAKNSMQLLHDAFFSAGALIMLFAALMFLSGEGAFWGIGYAFRGLARIFIPSLRQNHETYAQYRERKAAKPKEKGDHALFFTGLFFFLVSLIFLIIWYQL